MKTETAEAINIIGQEDFTELAPGVFQLTDGRGTPPTAGRIFIQDQDGETGLLVTSD